MAISIYVDSWKADKIDNYVRDAKEVELVKIGVTYHFEDTSVTPAPQGNLPPGYQLDQPETKKSQAELTKEWVKASPVDYAQFPRSTSDDVIKRTIVRDYPNYMPSEWVPLYKIESSHIIVRYDDKGNKLFIGFPWDIDFKNKVALFLFFAYPVYLLIRFIVWAVVTLKTQSGAHS
jgi:hypothetical protein